MNATVLNALATDQEPALRFITCGSVDDGKSTLIGRMLHDSAQIFDDQFAALKADSKLHGTQGERPDLALLVDGLQAEREQGITIDVAYRFFATAKRHFIVADCPGHEQYTRNMATGASTAQLAILLVDARKGLLTQTFRHSRIVALMGVKQVVLAVNKMDLVGYDASVFQRIEAEFSVLARELGFARVAAIPLSALEGDNVASRSAKMPWYEGPALLQHLEDAPVAGVKENAPLRLPVQWVNRPNPSFRGYAGRIVSGELHPGDAVRVLPGGTTTKIARLVAPEGDLPLARAGDSVMVTLEDERDVSRGDVLVSATNPCEVADQFEAHLVWLHGTPLAPGRSYRVRIHNKVTNASVTKLKFRLDVNTGAHLAGNALAMNEIGEVALSLDQPVAFEPYDTCPEMGAFVLLDRQTEDTVGAGMIRFALRRSNNVHWQELSVDAAARAKALQQTPRCIWLTGLSGSGKSTIASLLSKRLHADGKHTYVLDGDNVRHGLNRDLGFTPADRVENIRRVAEVAKLMVDAGLVVIVSFISPYTAERAWAKTLFPPGQFTEVFVDTPLEVCAQRDPKGLYAKARRSELPNFTGIDSAYEPPPSPDVVLRTATMPAEECVNVLMEHLEAPGNTA